MNQVKVTLFPELEDLKNLSIDQDFLKECAEHVKGLGYSSRYSQDQICIFKDGESSCLPGTLVGWRYVNEVEIYILLKLPEWYSRKDKTQEEVSRIFYLVSDIASNVSKFIIEDTI
jgi:hypothetical protein